MRWTVEPHSRTGCAITPIVLKESNLLRLQRTVSEGRRQVIFLPSTPPGLSLAAPFSRVELFGRLSDGTAPRAVGASNSTCHTNLPAQPPHLPALQPGNSACAGASAFSCAVMTGRSRRTLAVLLVPLYLPRRSLTTCSAGAFRLFRLRALLCDSLSTADRIPCRDLPPPTLPLLLSLRSLHHAACRALGHRFRVLQAVDPQPNVPLNAVSILLGIHGCLFTRADPMRFARLPGGGLL